jgi:hypothetical protein
MATFPYLAILGALGAFEHFSKAATPLEDGHRNHHWPPSNTLLTYQYVRACVCLEGGHTK